jgi:hypothetical protein
VVAAANVALVAGVALKEGSSGVETGSVIGVEIRDAAGREESPIHVPDIAQLNLWCAQGLPGAEHLNVDSLLRQLDAWAERVRTDTERHLYRFKRNPAEFDGSEAYFRMLKMAVVVHEDFRVRYNPPLIASPGLGSGPFFARPEDVFLHGLLGERRLGT